MTLAAGGSALDFVDLQRALFRLTTTLPGMSATPQHAIV